MVIDPVGSFGGMFNIERSLQKVKTDACQSKIKLPISEEFKKDCLVRPRHQSPVAALLLDVKGSNVSINQPSACSLLEVGIIDWRNLPESDKK